MSEQKQNFVHHILVVVRHLLSGTIIGALLLYAFIFWVGSPAQWRLEKEHRVLEQNYRYLEARLDEALDVLSDIGERDDNLYRLILQGEPIGKEARQRLVLNYARFDSLRYLDDAQLVLSVEQKMDLVERQLYLQSKSFDEVAALIQNQEDRLLHTPSIQPVNNKDLKQMASGYGWRVDPIYNLQKFHEGMDFSADLGTDIVCTANGRVIEAGWDTGGYGLCVVIDHGYGYKTRYAHMSKKSVSVGQNVKRGQKLGEVGCTGKSTGNHLHYEVWLRDQVQNPANYYFMDLSPEQYEEMLRLAESRNNVMD